MRQDQKFWAALLPLFFILIIDTMGVGLVFPIFGPLFINKSTTLLSVNVSYFYRDILYAITCVSFTFCMFLGAPILGDLSDKIGRKKVLMICLLGTSVGLILSGIAIQINNIPLLLFSRALTGFAAGSQPISQAAIADVSNQKNKAANLSLISLANCLGFLMGPLFGGYLADNHWLGQSSYALPFFASAGLAMSNFILLYFCFTETFCSEKMSKVELTKAFGLFVKAFKHPIIRVLAGIFLLHEIAWSLYIQYSGIYLAKKYSYTPEKLGFFMSWIALGAGFTLLVVSRLVSRWKLQQVVFVCMVSGVFIWLGLIFSNEWVEWLLSFPNTVVDILGYIFLIAIFSNSVSRQEQGWAMGVASAMASVGWTTGAILSGTIGQINEYFPFLFSALISVLAIIIAYNQNWLSESEPLDVVASSE